MNVLLRIKYYYAILFLVALYGFMYFCNYSTPLFTDDYWYSFIFGENSRRVSNLQDIFISQWNHFFTHGGRNVAHTIVQFFLYIDKPYFDIFNAAIFVLLLLLVYWLAGAERLSERLRTRWLIYIFFAIWTCIKAFGQTVFWLTGAVNYLWMTTLVLAFLLPYSLTATRPEYTFFSRKSMAVWMVLFGIMAGWTNENTGLVMLGIASVLTFYSYKTGRYQVWMLAGIIGAFIGYTIMISAPGNYVRAALDYGNVSLTEQLYGAIKMTVTRLMVGQGIIWGVLAVIFYKCWKYNLYHYYKKEFYYMLLFVIASVTNNLVMFASPSFPGRSGFGSTVFLIIAMMSGIHLLNKSRISLFPSVVKKMIWVAMACYLMSSMAVTIHDFQILRWENEQRIISVINQRQQGIEDITVKPYSIDDHGYFTHIYIADVFSNPDVSNIWVNEGFAKYYHVKTVRMLPEE